MMECKKVQRVILEWLKGKENLDAYIEHIKGCKNCQEFLRTNDPISKNFQEIIFSPPPFLFTRIKERIKVERKRRLLKRVLTISLAPALTAIILFLLLKNPFSHPVSPKLSQADLYKTHYIYKVTSSSISDPRLIASYLSRK